jgi:transposase-like protein
MTTESSVKTLNPAVTRVLKRLQYFEQSIARNGEPETVTIDKSGANHRAIKRRTRPMLGFKRFRCARILPGGIEVAHLIAKEQVAMRWKKDRSRARNATANPAQAARACAAE